jgi:hypothetical protein
MLAQASELLEKLRGDASADPSLQGRYESLWRCNRAALLRNEVSVDPVPEEGDHRWGVSVVLRPKLPRLVWAKLDALSRFAGQDHSYYSQANVHVTIRSAERYRANIPTGDDAIANYAAAMRVTLAPFQYYELRFKGLVATKTSLILCGYPLFDLAALRKRLHENLAQLGLTVDSPEPDGGALRNTCHASLAVFAGPLADPTSFAATIDDMLAFDFGTSVSYDAQLVSYRRTPDDVQVTTLVSV